MFTNQNRRRLLSRWLFLLTSLVLTGLYLRFQLVYSLAFVAQVLQLIAGRLGLSLQGIGS
jgi:hypothetical protein